MVVEAGHFRKSVEGSEPSTLLRILSTSTTTQPSSIEEEGFR